jgi:hypothetical protein
VRPFDFLFLSFFVVSYELHPQPETCAAALEVLELVIREHDFVGRNHAKPKGRNMVRQAAR